MVKIFFDTNIWIRLLTEDETPESIECGRVLEHVERGEILAFTSAIVIMEMYYVLTKLYGVPSEVVIEKIETLLKIRSLTVIEKTQLLSALELHSQTGVKLSDCMIVAQIPQDHIVCSYDRDFQKFSLLVVKTPREILIDC